MNNEKALILIVDDEPSYLTLIKETLELEGYLVECSSDGREVMDMILERNPHLIILDLLMPLMHGFDLLKKIKSNHATWNIPIIVTTGVYKGPMNRLEAIQSGADDFIEKPFNLDQLVEKVRMNLERY